MLCPYLFALYFELILLPFYFHCCLFVSIIIFCHYCLFLSCFSLLPNCFHHYILTFVIVCCLSSTCCLCISTIVYLVFCMFFHSHLVLTPLPLCKCENLNFKTQIFWQNSIFKLLLVGKLFLIFLFICLLFVFVSWLFVFEFFCL